MFGLAVATANALDIPREMLDPVMKSKRTGKPLRVTVSPSDGRLDFIIPSTTPIRSAEVKSPSPLRFDPPRQEATSMPSPPVERRPGDQSEKSLLVAYVLWLVFGLFGGHRYYLGRVGIGFLMTITVGVFGVWWIIDAFLIPSMVKSSR